MKLHGNARTCPHSRLLMVRRVSEQGWTLAAAAEAAGVSVRTVSKWLRRYRARARTVCSIVPRRRRRSRIGPRRSGWRRSRRCGRLRMTGAEIAECLRMPLSTVSAVLTRIGLGKLSRLEPLEPPNRYERKRPGELLHIDVKKLGRIRRRRPPRHRQPRQPNAGRHEARAYRDRRLGVRARLRRRRDPARLRRGARRREGHNRGRLPPPRGRPLPPPRHRGRAGDDRQRRRPTAPPSTRSPAKRSGSSTSAPAPTGPAPTGKPNASSAPCSAAGPTAPSTAAPTNAAEHSPAGSTSTITDDHTAPSATNHHYNGWKPSPGTTCLGLTSRRPPARIGVLGRHGM